MDIRIYDTLKTVANMEDAEKFIRQYAVSENLGKQQYITDAEIDGKQLIIIGTSMVDDDTIEPIALRAINEMSRFFGNKTLSLDKISDKGCDTGDLPKVKEVLIKAFENIFDAHIVYVWNEY